MVRVGDDRLFDPECEQPFVSAAMIVRNESANLARCLASIAEVVGEVVVLDTGSTDDTAAIARAMGARVFEDPWQDDFSLHRNRSIERCRGRWIFVIDGDETLGGGGGDLRRSIEAADAAGHDGVAVRIAAITDDGVGEQFYSIRAFLAERGRYRYPIHNDLTGIENPTGSSALIQASYEGPRDVQNARTLRILDRMLAEDPGSAHALFFKCKAFVSERRYEELLPLGERTLRVVQRDVRYAPLWLWMFDATFVLQGADAAEAFLARALGVHPGLADLQHRRMTMAAYRWQQAASQAGHYAFSGQVSPRFVAGLPKAAELLGLPVRFGPGAGVPREEECST